MDTSARPFAVVTGASSGIGLELARQFAGNGFDVLIAAEDAAIAQAATELAAGGAHVQPVQVDLASRTGVELLWSTIAATGRPVDAVAINAGVGVNGRFVDIDLDADLSLINLNVTAAVHLAKLVLRQMVARGSGRVLVTSSVAATMPGPYYATYAASKAFLQSFAQAVRYELRDSGVTVTALQPGPTDTEFFERAGMADTKAGASSKDDPAEVASQGFEALMAGKDHVVGGSAKNRAQTAAGKVLPETARAEIHARMTAPGSGS